MSNEHYGGIVEERKPGISEDPLFMLNIIVTNSFGECIQMSLTQYNYLGADRRLTLCFKHIHTRTQKGIIRDS